MEQVGHEIKLPLLAPAVSFVAEAGLLVRRINGGEMIEVVPNKAVF